MLTKNADIGASFQNYPKEVLSQIHLKLAESPDDFMDYILCKLEKREDCQTRPTVLIAGLQKQAVSPRYLGEALFFMKKCEDSGICNFVIGEVESLLGCHKFWKWAGLLS